jgi:hypothetical protein
VTFAGLLLGALLGCSNDDELGCGGIIAPTRTVTLTPASLSIDAGVDTLVAATVSGGCASDDRAVRWRSGDAAIATVDANGRVSAIAGGTTTITATAFTDRATASVALTVRPRTATTLRVTPQVDTLSPLGTRLLTPTVRDQTGTILAGVPVSFRSLTPNLASVTNIGLVSAIAAGTALIEASTPRPAADSLRDTVRVLIVTACSLVRPLPLGSVVSGRIDVSSCQNFSGFRAVDRYSVTAGTQLFFSVRMAPTAPMALVPLTISNTQHGLPVSDTAVTAHVVVRAGTFNLLATAPATTAGLYTLTTQLDPDPATACVVTDVSLGVSFRTAITPACPARDIRLLPTLASPQQLRVTGRATTFPVTLELRNATTGALLQRAVATEAGAQAVIAYTNIITGQLVRVRVIGTTNANDGVTITVSP